MAATCFLAFALTADLMLAAPLATPLLWAWPLAAEPFAEPLTLVERERRSLDRDASAGFPFSFTGLEAGDGSGAGGL